jgi:hypothetical protein
MSDIQTTEAERVEARAFLNRLSHIYEDPDDIDVGPEEEMINAILEYRADAVKEARADDHTRRWNCEKTEDGIRVCFGDHNRSADCTYIEYVPESAIADAVNAERERCAERAAKYANRWLLTDRAKQELRAAILSDDQEDHNG